MEPSIFLNFPLQGERRPVKLIIADDQFLFLETLGIVLSQFPFIQLTGMARNGMEVLDLVVKEKPDVVITDIQMPGMDGVELTKALLESYPDIRVIAMTAFEDEDYVVDMMEAGARGYLMKNASKEQVAEAIEVVLRNGTYYCEGSSMKLMRRLGASKTAVNLSKDASLLTAKEKEVVQLICQECSTKEISERLHVGEKTVEGYRKMIHEKLGVKNMAGVVVFAIRSGLFKV